MLAIFSEVVENIIEDSMDNFSVYGATFDIWLESLVKVLGICEQVNLVLHLENCHFMV